MSLVAVTTCSFKSTVWSLRQPHPLFHRHPSAHEVRATCGPGAGLQGTKLRASPGQVRRSASTCLWRARTDYPRRSASPRWWHLGACREGLWHPWGSPCILSTCRALALVPVLVTCTTCLTSPLNTRGARGTLPRSVCQAHLRLTLVGLVEPAKGTHPHPDTPDAAAIFF